MAADFSKLPNFYSLLGVSSSLSQTELDKEIKKRRREIAQENHPDLLNELPEDERHARTEKMYEANAACELLGDPEKRRVYDRWLQIGD